MIVITAPTAAGKTKLAINLAKKINGEIISADSRSVFRGLDIVSAKPSIEEMDGVCHHLIDIKDPLDEPYSAGDFCFDAKKCIEDIQSRGKTVIISGGTWFYIKCLLDSKMLPKIGSDKDFRLEMEKLEPLVLWEELNKIDSKRASEIHPNNKERVIRALEMANAVGGEILEAKREENNLNSIWFSNKFIDPLFREELYQRINLRVDNMIASGLYEEFKKMKEKFGRTKVLYNTIGYKEFFELEDGVWASFEEAVEKIKQRTRNFAKRQLTFFKTMPEINKVQNEDEIVEKLNTLSKQF